MFRIIPTERFSADVKYYIKKKHFIRIGEDIKKITDELEKHISITPGHLSSGGFYLSKIKEEIQMLETRNIDFSTRQTPWNGLGTDISHCSNVLEASFRL